MLLEYPVSIKSCPIIQEFGFDNTNHPQRKAFYSLFDNKHPGVDFETPVGAEIKASFEGIVVRKEFHIGMGNVIGIRNGSIIALYAHLSEFRINLGEIVSAKEIIGLSGDTGSACLEPHLHFELRDISKSPLKAMVFKPCFEQELTSLHENFIYNVNNENTQKTLRYLAIMYFGNAKYWEMIRDTNQLHIEMNDVLEQGKKIIIPNY